jgi:hypothetical protein
MNSLSFFITFNFYAKIYNIGLYILYLKSLYYSLFNFLNALLITAGNKIVVYIE